MTAGPRAAIYARVSTAGQQDVGSGLKMQEEACRAHAHSRGYTLTQVFRDVHTGTGLWEREQLSLLRAAVRRREIDAIIAHAIDRLARDPVHLGVIVSEAEHAGVEVLFVTEPLDNSPEGQLIRFVRGYAAKVEHEKIQERSIRGRMARVQAGKPLVGCRPPYGYQWNSERTALVVDPSTAPVVQRIFEEAIAGVPLRTIAAHLDRDGVPTPQRTGAWNHTSVRYMLGNPLYMGRATALRFRRERRPGRKPVTRFRATEETQELPGVAPALVDEVTFGAVAARLQQNRAAATRNNHYPEETLLRGGHVRCGYCGGNLTTQRSSDRRSWRYTCNPSIRERGGCRGVSMKAPDLDAAVWARVEELLTNPEIIAERLETQRTNDPTEANLASLQRSLDALDRKTSNLTRRLALLEDDDAAELVARELEAFAAQRRQLLTERDALLAQRRQWELTQAQIRSLTAWCGKEATRLAHLDYSTKRDILYALDMKATVWRVADRTPRYDITAEIALSYQV